MMRADTLLRNGTAVCHPPSPARGTMTIKNERELRIVARRADVYVRLLRSQRATVSAAERAELAHILEELAELCERAEAWGIV